MIAKLFPYGGIRTVRLYYMLQILLGSYFIAGVWYFVWRHFMSVQQVGLSDGLTFSAGFLFELPSGVWADMVGRHIAVRYGFAAMVIGNIGLTVGSSFWVLTLAFLMWTLGYTFQSGALDALVYDTLLEEGDLDVDKAWPQIVARAQMFGKTMTLVCTLLGAWLYAVWFRLPWLAFTVVSLAGLILSLRLPSDRREQTTHKLWHRAAYEGRLWEGMRVVFRPKIRAVAILAILVGAVDYTLSWGVLRPLVGVRFGFTAASLPVLQAVSSVAVVIGLYIASRAFALHARLAKAVGLGALAYGLCFLVLGLTHRLWLGGTVFVLVEVVAAVLGVAFSVYINKRTLSRHRATTLSTVSMLQRTPYAFLAVGLGWLGSRNLIGAFCMITGGLITLLVLLLLPKWSVAEELKPV
ncbi:MAG TPA: MFS transporter [Candidatus Saccharimonadales bacterium]|jgi:MFS family permease